MHVSGHTGDLGGQASLVDGGQTGEPWDETGNRTPFVVQDRTQ